MGIETDEVWLMLEMKPCIRSGWCCQQAPCPFGEVTSPNNPSCIFLGGDTAGEHFCMKYEEIQAGMPDNMADISPAFNTGCGSALNPVRKQLLQIRKS